MKNAQKTSVKKSENSNSKKFKITRQTLIFDAIEKYPELINFFFDLGMGCAGCPAARHETIENGARKHGFDENEIDEMIEEICEILK